MHGSIAFKKQDQNNTIDELKSKKQLQTLQKIDETLKYTKRHSMQRIN